MLGGVVITMEQLCPEIPDLIWGGKKCLLFCEVACAPQKLC